jgi:putative SOS response-associated peptidase YedK
MCNRRAARFKMADIEYYYSAKYSKEFEGMVEGDGNWEPVHHIHGYDHSFAPIVTSKDPEKIQMFMWGLIPHNTGNVHQAMEAANMRLLARSEDMYFNTYSELAKYGKRCLIPSTGYFEHKHLDPKGKKKHPYYIWLKDRPIFSMGGLYSVWKDPLSGRVYKTYAVCTTDANDFVAEIHNTGKRQPVILPDKESEQAWLNSKLPQVEVMKLCKAIPSEMMDAHTIRKTENTADASVHFEYPELFAKA